MLFYTRPVTELIVERSSVRTYMPSNLKASVKKDLVHYMKTVQGLNDSPVKLSLIDKEVANGAKIGTYGVIKGCRHFITSAIPKGDSGAPLNLGYTLEKVALFAQDAGLGTVWLGGTFNKGEFAKAAGLGADEILPIVMPVGYPAEKKSVLESLMRRFAGSSARKGWAELFFDADPTKPLSEADAGEYKTALEAVRRAPSAMNGQPWRIVRMQGRFDFYKKSAIAVEGADMGLVDMGIAMCHFELTAREAGLEGSWVFEKPSNSSNWEYVSSWLIK